MDCCPVMVSDLPVMCSRIDGIVTVVKAEPPDSKCHDFYWGKSGRLCTAAMSAPWRADRWLARSGTACCFKTVLCRERLTVNEWGVM